MLLNVTVEIIRIELVHMYAKNRDGTRQFSWNHWPSVGQRKRRNLFDNFNSFRPWSCKEWSDGLNESEVAFDALGKREDTKRVAFAHHQQTGGLVKKLKKKEKIRKGNNSSRVLWNKSGKRYVTPLSQGASRWQPLVSVVWNPSAPYTRSLMHAPTTKETIGKQVGQQQQQQQPPIGYGWCQTAHEETSSIELQPNDAHCS